MPHLVGRLHLQPHARLREAGFAQPRHQLAPLHRGVGLAEIVERKGLHAILELLDQLQEAFRSEEHTSELQSLMRISYAVFCLKKKKIMDVNIKPSDLQKEHN